MVRLFRFLGFALLIGLMSLALQACESDEEDAPEEPESSAGLQVGEAAPAFTLPSVDGNDVSLADYVGEQPVLLYFHMAVG